MPKTELSMEVFGILKYNMVTYVDLMNTNASNLLGEILLLPYLLDNVLSYIMLKTTPELNL